MSIFDTMEKRHHVYEYHKKNIDDKLGFSCILNKDFVSKRTKSNGSLLSKISYNPGDDPEIT